MASIQLRQHQAEAGESGLTSQAERGRLALLSALAEAPDLAAAATFLLADVLAGTGGRRALLLRFDTSDEHLILAGAAGFDDPVLSELTIAERSHPWMVATLALSPVLGDAPPRVGPVPPFENWTALPMPRPHYRGAPAIWSDSYATQVLAPLGAKLVPLEDRRFSSAPGGVVIVDTVVPEPILQDIASVVMFAGPVVFRVAAHMDAERGYDRVSQERGRFQQMVDSLPDPVVITDASNDIVVQNKRAEHLLFVTEDDSPGRRRAVELNNLLFSSFLSRATIGGTPSSGARELNLVDPDEGHDLLFEVLTHPLGARVGPDDSVLSVLRDVTDLRRASHELERQVQRVRQAEFLATEERDRLNLILENVADPILVTDSLANIILMNDEAEQLFHGPPTGQTYRSSQAVRQNDMKVTSFISDFALTNERTRRELMSLTHPRSSVELPVEIVSGKIRNERGEPMAIVSVIHDRTQQAENERLYEALKQLNSELEGRIAAATKDLAQQNERLLWQSEELAKANKLKSDFLASMSHELRTPLNAVIGYSALLLDGIAGPLQDAQSDFVARSRSAAQHLLSLINDILDLAKIEAGKMPVYVEHVSLAELIDEVSNQVEPMVAAKRLSFTTDVAPGCATIETDKTKVKQILLNLLSNAVKFTNKGTVRVSVSCIGDDAVLLEVHDTGVGIKPEELDAIWEDFRQLDQSRTRSFGGTGLGLSITRRLTQQLGGQVNVQSVFGTGTTFSVRLPMAIQGSPLPTD